MDFQSQLEDVDAVTKRVTASVPPAELSSRVDAALSQIAQSAKIKGFRPGKAPRALVERLHGERVLSEVTGELVSTVLRETVSKHELRVVGRPAVDIKAAEIGKELTFTAELSLLPEPTIAGYDKLPISVPKREVKNEQVDEVLERIRTAKATVRPSAKPNAEKGDGLVAEISVFPEGGTPEQGEEVRFCIGDAVLPAEVEEALVGIAPGETREHAVNAGEDRKLVYRTTVKELFERLLPELDDGFVKSLGEEMGTVLELRMRIRENLERENAELEQADVHSAMLDLLSERNDFAIPNAMIDEDIRELLVRRRVVDPDKVDVSRLPMEGFREHFGELARKRVKAAVIIDRIAAQEKIDLTKEEIDASLQQFASAANIPIDALRQYIASRPEIPGFIVEAKRNKVFSFLQDRAKITHTEQPSGAESPDAEQKPKKRKRS